jgi:hypothetical protein
VASFDHKIRRKIMAKTILNTYQFELKLPNLVALFSQHQSALRGCFSFAHRMQSPPHLSEHLQYDIGESDLRPSGRATGLVQRDPLEAMLLRRL